MEPTGIQLAHVTNATVILVDYKAISFCYYRRCAYEIIPAIGRLLAEFIEMMRFDAEKIEMIGHSIGAHIAGVTGAQLNGKLGKITGKLKIGFWNKWDTK